MARLVCFSILVLTFLVSPARGCHGCIHRSKLAYQGDDAVNGGICGFRTFAQRLNGGNVAAASSTIYNQGLGCSSCFQIRCLDPKLCSKSGTTIVVTDLTTSNQSDFVVPKRTFSNLALPNRGSQLLEKGIVDIQYKRIFCEYKGHNLTLKVGEDSYYPYYLAVQLLYQGGQTEIVSVDVAQVGGTDWHALRRRNFQAVWEIVNPPTSGPLEFRFQVTSGYDGYWLWTKRSVLPSRWKAGELYDSGLQINQTSIEGCTQSCDDNDRLESVRE